MLLHEGSGLFPPLVALLLALFAASVAIDYRAEGARHRSPADLPERAPGPLRARARALLARVGAVDPRGRAPFGRTAAGAGGRP